MRVTKYIFVEKYRKIIPKLFMLLLFNWGGGMVGWCEGAG